MNAEESRKLQAAVLQSQLDRRSKIAPRLPQGFTFRPEGRSGFIYYRAGDRVLEISIEMSGVAHYDMLVWPEGLDEWVYPEYAPLTADERMDVRSRFSTWLSQQKFKTDYQ
jgi:hypothetical protein